MGKNKRFNDALLRLSSSKKLRQEPILSYDDLLHPFIVPVVPIILNMLSFFELCKVRSVCKRFKHVVDQRSFWRGRFSSVMEKGRTFMLKKFIEFETQYTTEWSWIRKVANRVLLETFVLRLLSSISNNWHPHYSTTNLLNYAREDLSLKNGNFEIKITDIYANPDITIDCDITTEDGRVLQMSNYNLEWTIRTSRECDNVNLNIMCESCILDTELFCRTKLDRFAQCDFTSVLDWFMISSLYLSTKRAKQAKRKFKNSILEMAKEIWKDICI